MSVVTSGVTSESIQRLLMRQYFADSKQWNSECARVIDDFRAHNRNPRSPAIDCTAWCSAVRPEWPADERTAQLRDTNLPFEFDAYATPLWGWLAVAKWNGANDANVSGLFGVLMHGGCDSAAALNARHNGDSKTGYTLLMTAASSCERAFDLLIAQPVVAAGATRLYGPHLFTALIAALWARSDARAKDVLARLSRDERIRDIKALHLAVAYGCPNTALAMLPTVVGPDACAADACAADACSVLMSCVGMCFLALPPAQQYCEQLLATAASVADGRVFALLTMPWLTAAAGSDAVDQHNDDTGDGDTGDGDGDGRHAPAPRTRGALAARAFAAVVKATSRKFHSPLCTALCSDANDRDDRGAWLALRLPSEHLNRYHSNGMTPVLMAATQGLSLTLRALLSRGVEVDLTARPIALAKQKVVAVDALAHEMTEFDAECAADLLAAPLPQHLQSVAQELRAQTKWQRDTLPGLIADTLVPALLFGAELPRDLVRVVCTYAGAAAPKVWPQPHPALSQPDADRPSYKRLRVH